MPTTIESMICKQKMLAHAPNVRGAVLGHPDSTYVEGSAAASRRIVACLLGEPWRAIC